MMSTSHDKRFSPARSRAREVRAAFTLVEVLVALAVMMLLLTIILVPVNMALDVFHIGKARNEVQLSNNTVLNQLAAELRQAVFVYPNEAMPGITNKSPYSTDGTTQKPYYDTATSQRVSNTSRLDFLLPAKDSNGSTSVPTQASNYIVTYYARRIDTANAFDTYSNPVALYRAQYAYRNDATSSTNTANLVNASASRYSDWSNTSNNWLKQSNGEPNLQTQSDVTPPNFAVASANHLMVSPRDMVLVAPNAEDATPSYQPNSSFICDDTNADGKIDRVTISLNLAKYDSGGAQSKSQQLRLSRVVNLPNVK
jgi:type II secretory pathway pseudopilin PulG